MRCRLRKASSSGGASGAMCAFSAPSSSRAAQALVEARALVLQVLLRYFVVPDLEPRRRHQVRVADGDAARYRRAGEDEVHSPSPNLSAISSRSAASACSASGPSASMVTLAPRPAASIMTPMMLLALTRRPLRDTQMSLW